MLISKRRLQSPLPATANGLSPLPARAVEEELMADVRIIRAFRLHQQVVHVGDGMHAVPD